MIYLIRHGETIWNREGRYQGRHDSPLTKKGAGQAKIIANLLLNDNFKPLSQNTYLVSPLPRTKQFANLICEEYNILVGNNENHLNFSWFVEKNVLVEQSFGDWEGRKIDHIRYISREKYNKREKYKWDYVPPNGESYSMTFNRIVENLEKDILDMSSFGVNVIVTHGVVSRIIRGIILNYNSHEILSLNHPQDVLFKLFKDKVKTVKL